MLHLRTRKHARLKSISPVHDENGGEGRAEEADRRAERRVGKLDVQFLRHYKSIHLRFNQVGERRARASYRKRVIYLQELTFTTWCL